MDDDGSYGSPRSTNDGPGGLDALLGPGVSGLVAFTLAVLVLMGNNLMVLGTQSIFGQVFQPSGPTGYFLTYGLGTVVPGAASLLLARRALGTGSVLAWEGVLARAAVVLSVVGLFYGALTVVGGFLHQF